MSTQENNINKKEVKVLPAGVPFLAAGGVWFILAMILPVYKLSMVIVISVIAAAVCAGLIAKRNKQLALLPPPPVVKVRAEELAKKLDDGRDVLLAKVPEVASAQVRAHITSIADTLEKIADEVEADPKDRNKARKLANHYVGMMAELVDKYILMQKQSAGGTNITTSMAKIEEGLAGADVALKKLLDDLFTDEAMEVSADIAVLENLLNMESAEPRMDFSAIE